jgi:hypothetical protein
MIIDAIDLADGMTELNSKDYANPTGSEAQLDVNQILSAGCNMSLATGGDWEGPTPANTGVGFNCAAAPGGAGAGNLTNSFRAFTTPDDAWGDNVALGWALTNINFPSLATITNATATLAPQAFQFIPAAGFEMGPGAMSYHCTNNGTDISSACAAISPVPVLNGMAWDFPLTHMYAGDVWSVSFNLSVDPSFPSAMLNLSIPVDLCENTTLWTGCTGAPGSFYSLIEYTNYVDSAVVQSFPPVFVEVVNSSSAPVVSSVTVSPTQVTLNVTDSQSFVANSTCTGGPCPTGVSYSWAMMNGTSLGTLNSTVWNNVTFTAGTSGGQLWLAVNVTLNYVTIESSPISITIIPPAHTLATLTVSPSSASLLTGNYQSFSAAITCAYGACPAGTVYVWTTNNTLGSLNTTSGPVVTFTAGSTGGVTSLVVNATLNGISIVSSPISIGITYIPPPGLASVMVSPTTATVDTNGSMTFTAIPDCSVACPSGIVYSWTVNKIGLGSINSSTGNPVTFTAVSTAGALVLFVNATLNGKTVQSPPVDITVTAGASPTLSSVSVSPQSGSVYIGETIPFNAVATCSSGPCPSGLAFAWTLSNALGTLSPPTGSSTTFTASTTLGEVTLTVTATLNGISKSATATITVTALPVTVLESVTITPSSLTLAEGDTDYFTATPVCTSDGSEASCPSVSYSWELSDSITGRLLPEMNTVALTAGNNTGTGLLTVTCTLNGKSVTGNATITVVVSSGGPGPTPSSSNTTGYFIALAVAVAVAAIAILILVQRRKKAQKAALEEKGKTVEQPMPLDPPAPPEV